MKKPENIIYKKRIPKAQTEQDKNTKFPDILTCLTLQTPASYVEYFLFYPDMY